MKRLLIFASCVLGTVMLGGGAASAATTHVLSCGPGNVFNPTTINAQVGDKVDVDLANCPPMMVHPVAFETDPMAAVTTKTFTTAGTVKYRCLNPGHSTDFDTGMVGKVVVTAPVVDPPPPPPPTTTTTTTPPPPPPPPADTTPPTTTLTASASLKIGALLSKGSSVTVKSNEAGTIKASLSIGNKVIASGQATAAANADTKVALKVTKVGKSILKKKRPATATLKVETTDAAGNKKTDTKKVKLRK